MNNINKLKILIVTLTSVLQFANLSDNLLRKGKVATAKGNMIEKNEIK